MREQIPGDAWDGNGDEEYNGIRFHFRLFPAPLSPDKILFLSGFKRNVHVFRSAFCGIMAMIVLMGAGTMLIFVLKGYPIFGLLDTVPLRVQKERPRFPLPFSFFLQSAFLHR